MKGVEHQTDVPFAFLRGFSSFRVYVDGRPY